MPVRARLRGFSNLSHAQARGEPDLDPRLAKGALRDRTDRLTGRHQHARGLRRDGQRAGVRFQIHPVAPRDDARDPDGTALFDFSNLADAQSSLERRGALQASDSKSDCSIRGAQNRGAKPVPCRCPCSSMRRWASKTHPRMRWHGITVAPLRAYDSTRSDFVESPLAVARVWTTPNSNG